MSSTQAGILFQISHVNGRTRRAACVPRAVGVRRSFDQSQTSNKHTEYFTFFQRPVTLIAHLHILTITRKIHWVCRCILTYLQVRVRYFSGLPTYMQVCTLSTQIPTHYFYLQVTKSDQVGRYLYLKDKTIELPRQCFVACVKHQLFFLFSSTSALYFFIRHILKLY